MVDEATRCRRLLELKDDFSLSAHYRLNFRRHLFSVFLFVVCVYLVSSGAGAIRYAAVLATGILVGGYARDLGWLLQIKRTWPLTVRITDWNLVGEIAEGVGQDEVTT